MALTKIDTTMVFSTKADYYAKYRWDYAPKSIAKILEMAGLSQQSCVADIGAGTGILTKHFLDKVRRIYAVEPNTEMRQIAARDFASVPSVEVIDGSAEATTLGDHCIDLITVAQSIHWFDPEPSKREMQRILRQNGWLAIIRNNTKSDERNDAIGALMTEKYGAIVQQRPPQKPMVFFFGHSDYQTLVFPFQSSQTWEQFIGSLLSASFMPNEDNSHFPALQQAARQVFDQFSTDGVLATYGETELRIGQPSW